ncbi:MAG: branched-chain amino acid ABC transporter permease [Actinomycetales bacterium]|nr:branched-chain amino acid ABC transporter permease [Actinomycetales bacterium]
MMLPGSRLVQHAAIALAIWVALTRLNQSVDPLLSYYLALVGMYATAMFGMTILVGLSGQVSLGNGALMAVGGYAFALTSLNWKTVPILGLPWNAVWSVVFAGIFGILVGLVIGGLAARLKGPYLAGLTLGVAVGVPAIANRFPGLFGGENGLMLTVPYPQGGYDASAVDTGPADTGADAIPTEAPDLPTEQAPIGGESLAPSDLLTVDDLGGAVSSAAPSVAPSDLITPDDLMGATGAPIASMPAEPSALASAGTDLGSTASGGVDAGSVDVSAVGGLILEQWQATLSITMACIMGFVALNLVRSRQGRTWQAVRDDSIAAAVSGINPSRSKVSAFVVSSLFAALAGAVFAQLLTYVGPGAYGLGLSLSLLVGIVLGGRASLLGAIIGAVLLVWLPVVVDRLSADRGWPEPVTNNAPNLLYGLLVVLVVLLAPGGITGTIRQSLAPVLRRRD